MPGRIFIIGIEIISIVGWNAEEGPYSLKNAKFLKRNNLKVFNKRL